MESAAAEGDLITGKGVPEGAVTTGKGFRTVAGTICEAPGAGHGDRAHRGLAHRTTFIGEEDSGQGDEGAVAGITGVAGTSGAAPRVGPGPGDRGDLLIARKGNVLEDGRSFAGRGRLAGRGGRAITRGGLETATAGECLTTCKGSGGIPIAAGWKAADSPDTPVGVE